VGAVLASWFLIASLLTAHPTSPEVRQLVHDSIREYNAGDFDLALRDAKRAYEISGLPALLYNLGQCHRALGHWKEAIFYYRGYLRERHDAANREEVIGILQELAVKESAAQHGAALPAAPPPAPAPVSPTVIVEAAPPAPAAAVSETPERAARPGALTWSLGGIGVAALATGTVLGVVTQGQASQDGAKQVNGVTLHQLSPGAYAAEQNEALAADVLWSVGGALAVAAIVAAVTGH
jgi:tetratricopeptide (TPR) repeat protein